MADLVYKNGTKEIQEQVETLFPKRYRVNAETLKAYRLNIDDDNEPYCSSIVSEITGLIGKNDLDSVSETISKEFNVLYKLYGAVAKQ